MAKLRMQVLILAVCLTGVVMAKHYVGKIAAQAAAADTGKAVDEATSGPGVVQMP